MDVNDAVAIINSSKCNSEEKNHLRTLVRTGGILPASFAGTPDFDEILKDFPPSAPVAPAEALKPADVHDNSSNDQLIAQLVQNLPVRFAHTAKKPKLPEENFCRRNLYAILNLVLYYIDIDRIPFSVRSGVDLWEFCKYFLVKATSVPKTSLVYDDLIWKCGVIGGDSRTVDNGYHEAAAQGVSVCADFAMDIADMGVPIHKVLVPFILTFSDSVQFGAVYLIDENFPCQVMLSPPLSLMTEETRVSIAKWVLALAKFCDKQAMTLASSKIPTVRLNNKCKLHPERLFFKPIMADCIERASFAVTHLLSAFQLLNSHEPCKKYIVFPLGRMGMPGDTQYEMKTLLLSILDDKFKTSHVIDMVTTIDYISKTRERVEELRG
eukprot:gene32674-42316_t